MSEEFGQPGPGDRHDEPVRVDNDGDERRAALERLHVLEGLLIALERWEELSAVVSQSDDRDAVKARLRQPPYTLSGVQAEHVLDLPLARRTVAARALLEEEVTTLRQLVGP